MKSHVANTVSVCFAILHQVQSIRQSGPRAVFQSLVMSHIVSWLDYGNATISPSLVPAHRSSIQLMMKCASQLVFSPLRYDHSTLPLHELYWVNAAEKIDYKLALLVYKCRQGAVPVSYTHLTLPTILRV